MEKLGYKLPVVMIILIFLLKLAINEKFSLESLKRLIVETAVDVVSLGISFIISYIIAVSNKIMNLKEVNESGEKTVERNLSSCMEDMAYGMLLFVIYIVMLLIIVLITKFSVQKYNEKEELHYIIIGGIIGYVFAVPCMAYAIYLLKNLGGM